MRYYHGSQVKFDDLLPPSVTGVFRKSEEGRRHHLDVVFLTTCKELALQYAGPEGYLYIVEATDAKVYRQTGKKKPVVNKSVYTAKDTKIIFRLKLAKRRRGQPHRFHIV